jgi:hypothetical protein
MNILRFFGAALALTMLGGVVALAQSAQAAQVSGSQVAVSSPATAVQALAWASNLPRRQQAAAVRQASQEPKTLKFANFGQWDEAASEN